MQLRSRITSFLALALACGSGAVATPPEPAAVSNALLAQAPYAATGLVSARVPNGLVLGSGSAVDTRVVLTAAHVFFDDDRLGWNSSVWTWQRAARTDNFGSYQEELNARSMRVLAGYSSAVQTYSPSSGVSLEEFNRDTLCMISYGDAAEGHVMPLAPDAVTISGLKMTVGYPIDLPSGERPVGQMSAHGPGGLLATFSRQGAATDRAGYANQVYRTRDFTSGPGGSGGPLVSALDGVWKQTGVLVGGATDFSSLLVREIDEDAMALIAAAKNDASNPGSGGGGGGGGGGEVRPHTYVLTGLPQGFDFCFRENGQAILASDGLIRFLNADGSEARRLNVPIQNPLQIAEAPNGALYVSEAYGLVAISPDTGEILWRFSSGAHRFAVGVDSTIYTAGPWGNGGVCAITPGGALEWWAPAGENISTADTPLGLLGDGTVIFQVPGGMKAFRPDGTERWSQFIDGTPLGRTLAIGPDDTIYVAAHGPRLLALHPHTGATKWTYAFNAGSTPAPPTVAPDGTIYVGNGSSALAISAAGTLVRTIPLGEYADAPTVVGADGTIYVGTFDRGTRAYTSTGTLKWTYPDGGGQLRLSPTGQLFTRGKVSYWDTVRVVDADGGPDRRTWSSLEGGMDGGFRAHAAQPIAPRLQGWMTNQKVEPGAGFALRMRVAGAGPFSYVWRKDGQPVSGAIASVLRVDAAKASDAGSYTLTASNAAGSVTSPAATITVGTAAPGEMLWQTPILWNNSTIAVAGDGTTYVSGRLRSGSGEPEFVFALDRSGNEIWRHLISYYHYGARHLVVSDHGGVFLSTSEDALMSLSSIGGARWNAAQTALDRIHHAALTQEGDLLVTGSGAGFSSPATIACFSSQTGQVRWSHGSSSFINNGVSAPKVAPDGVIFFSPGNALRAYSSNGTMLWEQAGVGQVQGFSDVQGVFVAKPGGGLLVGVRADGADGSDLPGVGGSNIIRRTDGGYFSSAGLWSPSGDPLLSIYTQYSTLAIDALGNAYVRTGDGLKGYTAGGAEFFSLATGSGSLVLTRDGGWIGGGPISKFKAHAPLADSTWPMVDGNPGRTNRLATADHPVPRIVSRSAVTEGPAGSRLVLEVAMASQLPLTYTWWRDDVRIDGAASARLVLDPLGAGDAGTYRLMATASNGWTTSATWQVTVAAASTQAGYYRGSAGSLTVMAHAGPDGSFDLVGASPDGGFAAHDIAVAASGPTAFTIAEGSPAGGATATFQNGVVSLTLPDGRQLDLARTGGQLATTPRADTYRGRALGTEDARLDMIVDSVGNWIWRATRGSAAAAGADTVPPPGATRDIGPMTATFHDPGMLRGTTPAGSLPVLRYVAVAEGLGLRSRFSNISTRGHLQMGASPMIAGIVTQGDESQRLLLRAIGPSLSMLGVSAPADAVRIDLYRGAAHIDENQFWWSSSQPSELRAAMQQVSAFNIDSYSLDSAVYRTLSPGLFTAHVSPAGESGGIALVEVYDNGTERGTLRSSRAVNLSTRGHAGTGERVLIAGLVIVGDVPKRILLRGVGPGLVPLGVTDHCLDPQITLYDQNGNALATNDTWDANGATARLRQAFSQVGAFDLTPRNTDAAMIAYLEPGVYTAMVSARSGAEGTALVEVYELEW